MIRFIGIIVLLVGAVMFIRSLTGVRSAPETAISVGIISLGWWLAGWSYWNLAFWAALLAIFANFVFSKRAVTKTIAVLGLALMLLGGAINTAFYRGNGNDNGLGGASAQTKTTLPSDGMVEIVDANGEKRVVPFVKDDGRGFVSSQTLDDPRSPSVYAQAKEQGPLKSWADAERILGPMQWYVDAVNARKAQTGFGWADVQKWARDGETQGVNALSIHVYNWPDKSDEAARNDVRELIGDLADKIPVVNHTRDSTDNRLMNTRGFDGNVVEDFNDGRKMVRVSLNPFVYNDKGEIIGLRKDAGVFIDCFNLWWLFQELLKLVTTTTTQPGVSTTQPGVATTQPTTSTTRPGVTPTTQPPGSTTSTTRPGGTTTTTSPPGTTSTTTPTGSTTTTAPPPEIKCFDAQGRPVYVKEHCGSGGTVPTHPQFPPVQSEPISDPTLNDPTPGYVPGSAETTSQQQTTAATSPPYTPSPSGQQSPSPSGTSGQTVTPSGTPVTGGTSGVTQPDSSPGHQTQPVNTTPVAPVGGPTPPGGLTPP